MFHHVAGIVDVFPVRLRRPRDPLWRRETHNGKYHGYVFKVYIHIDCGLSDRICLLLFPSLQYQFAVDNTGVPVWLEGPNLGRRHDFFLYGVRSPRLPLRSVHKFILPFIFALC